MSLEKEMVTYRREVSELNLHPDREGKFAVIHDGIVIGYWDTFDDALTAGYDKLGTEPFLAKKLVRDEKPAFFSRNVRPHGIARAEQYGCQRKMT